MRRPCFALVFAAVFLALSLPFARAGSLITAADLLQLRPLGSVALSPDGRDVVYTVKSIEPKPGAQNDYVYHTHLWLAHTDGRTPPRPLTFGAAGGSAPAWSPDGKQIAFVRPVDGKPQIFVLPLQAGGEAWAVTKLDYGATNPRWSPDGRQLAFTATLSSAELRQLEPDARPAWPDERPSASPDGTAAEQREWLAKHEADANPRVLNRLEFLGESGLEPTLSFTHVYVVDVRDGAEPRRVTRGYVSYSDPQWLPGGRSLVVVRQRNADAHPDREWIDALYAVDLDGANLRPLVTLATHSLGSPRVSPDGRHLAFTAQPVDDRAFGARVAGIAASDGRQVRLLTAKLDRSVGALAWSDDSQHLYFTAASNGGVPLYRVAIAGGAPSRLTDFECGVRAYDLHAGRLAAIITTPQNPYELFASDLDAQAPVALTTHNSEWLADKTLSLPSRHRLKRPDGLTVEYWLMKPAGFEPGQKYPLLLEIHGGPAAMWGPGEDTMWHEFQFFAARGYGIVFSNPRGSGGYGHAYQKANYRDWGAGPAGDVLAAADLAAQEPWIDAGRQVVTGGSYGGYLTAWIVAHDHRFKAAIAARGVYDLTTFFGEGNAWSLVPDHFGGYPWQKDVRALLEANSPFTYVDQITTPLLITHGDADRRTGFVQSEMLYRALKVLERPVEYARYPGATHEMSRSGDPRQRLDRLVRCDEFFRRFIGEN